MLRDARVLIGPQKLLDIDEDRGASAPVSAIFEGELLVANDGDRIVLPLD